MHKYRSLRVPERQVPLRNTWRIAYTFAIVCECVPCTKYTRLFHLQIREKSFNFKRSETTDRIRWIVKRNSSNVVKHRVHDRPERDSATIRYWTLLAAQSAIDVNRSPRRGWFFVSWMCRATFRNSCQTPGNQRRPDIETRRIPEGET